jgi:hypothetical protein
VSSDFLNIILSGTAISFFAPFIRWGVNTGTVWTRRRVFSQIFYFLYYQAWIYFYIT